MMLQALFWILLIIILYAYIGYALILWISVRFFRLVRKRGEAPQGGFEPPVTLLIPAFNESEYVGAKAENILELNYPVEKLHILWVTDGSSDHTDALLARFPQFKVMHEDERRGKIHAMNRGMKQVSTPLVVFTDANTMLNPDAIREIVRHFADEKTGCVAGEKRIHHSGSQKAVAAGEGLYWQYESWIKRLESETASVMGAAGELFAVRTALYEPVQEDTLLDDFTISMQILQQGYRIQYAPGAWGTESASLNITEELKRKSRIAAGGIQALSRMTGLLNPFRYGLVSWMYISHKVLRWTIVPAAFPLVLGLNLLIILQEGHPRLFDLLMLLQGLYYMLVLAGRLLHNVRLRFRIGFVPYYLFIMNYSIIKGLVLFVSGKYSVNWQKVKRS